VLTKSCGFPVKPTEILGNWYNTLSTDVTSQTSVCSYQHSWKKNCMHNSRNKQLYSLDIKTLRFLESSEAGLIRALKLQRQVATCIARSHTHAVIHMLLLTYHTKLAVVTKLKQYQKHLRFCTIHKANRFSSAQLSQSGGWYGFEVKR